MIALMMGVVTVAGMITIMIWSLGTECEAEKRRGAKRGIILEDLLREKYDRNERIAATSSEVNGISFSRPPCQCGDRLFTPLGRPPVPTPLVPR